MEELPGQKENTQMHFSLFSKGKLGLSPARLFIGFKISEQSTTELFNVI